MEIMELSINIPNNDYLIGKDTKLFFTNNVEQVF